MSQLDFPFSSVTAILLTRSSYGPYRILTLAWSICFPMQSINDMRKSLLQSDSIRHLLQGALDTATMDAFRNEKAKLRADKLKELSDTKAEKEGTMSRMWIGFAVLFGFSTALMISVLSLTTCPLPWYVYAYQLGLLLVLTHSGVVLHHLLMTKEVIRLTEKRTMLSNACATIKIGRAHV